MASVAGHFPGDPRTREGLAQEAHGTTEASLFPPPSTHTHIGPAPPPDPRRPFHASAGDMKV